MITEEHRSALYKKAAMEAAERALAAKQAVAAQRLHGLKARGVNTPPNIALMPPPPNNRIRNELAAVYDQLAGILLPDLGLPASDNLDLDGSREVEETYCGIKVPTGGWASKIIAERARGQRGMPLPRHPSYN